VRKEDPAIAQQKQENARYIIQQELLTRDPRSVIPIWELLFWSLVVASSSAGVNKSNKRL
jgi:hypothetical protein